MTCGALRLYVYVSRGEMDGSYDESEHYPEDVEKAIIASHVAAVASMATEAARADPSESLPVAVGALGWAHEVAKCDPALFDALHIELENLKRAVRKGKWTHTTPVVWTTYGWKKTGGP
jgi:hypothetical protein